MISLKVGLVVSTIAIWIVTVLTVVAYGFNWPAVYFGDLVQLDWRSQFNTDLVIHIILLAVWVAWRGKVCV